MGGEFTVVLIAIGLLFGIVAAVSTARRSKKRGLPLILRIGVAFVVGVLAPLFIFVAIGTIIKLTQPQPTVQELHRSRT
jgi:hypothetical protein